MDKGVLSFQEVKPNYDLMREIWQFDARRLEQTDGTKVGLYATALAQYLIFLQSQINLSKSEISQLKRFIDATINTLIQPEDIKVYGSKTGAKDYLVAITPSLQNAQDKIDQLTSELILLEGIDKSIYEYIATLKRELTRRENELYATRQERRSN